MIYDICVGHCPWTSGKFSRTQDHVHKLSILHCKHSGFQFTHSLLGQPTQTDHSAKAQEAFLSRLLSILPSVEIIASLPSVQLSTIEQAAR